MTQQHSNLPKAWQSILAAGFGVGIGLVITNYYKHDHASGNSAKQSTVIATVLASDPSKVGGTATASSDPTKQRGLLDFSDFNLWPKLDKRMNVLLMGVDSNGRDTERFTGCRSDTMMIASLDPVSGCASLVSLPRDSRVRIADNHGVDKINAAHALGGPELAVKTVSEDFAVPIDHYVVIDVQGLKKVFEVLGPVDVIVEKPMHYKDHAGRLNIALEPGVVTMDAAKLEEYVRFRHDAKGDIGRIERQQWFMRQVKKKLEEPQVLLKLPDLFKLANDYVRTDLSIEEMAKLAGFCKGVKPNQIQTAMLPGQGTCIGGGSYWLPDPEAAAIVLHRLLGSPLAAATIASNTGSTVHNVVNNRRGGGSTDASTTDGAAKSGLAEAGADNTNEAGFATNDSVNNTLAASYSDKPLSVVIRYPRGGEAMAKTLEERMIAQGLTVKFRQRGEAAECAHEQIIETSFRADEGMAGKLKSAVAELEPFPAIVSPDQHASADFIVVLSSGSQIAAALPPESNQLGTQPQTQPATTDIRKGSAVK